MDWVQILIDIFTAAVVPVIVSVLTTYYLDSRKERRVPRQRLDDTLFPQLFREISFALSLIQNRQYEEQNAPRRSWLRVVRTDRLFGTLNPSEQRLMNDAATALEEYVRVKETAMHKLRAIWDDKLQALTYKEHPLDDFGTLWNYAMSISSDAEKRILEKYHLDQETKERAVQLLKETVTEFKETSEFQAYEDTRENTLPKIKALRRFLEL